MPWLLGRGIQINRLHGRLPFQGDPMAQLVWRWSCQRWQTAGGGSNPCWSTRESQVRPAERQRAPTTKKHGRLPFHSRAQRRLVCRNGMGNHPCWIPRHWRQNSSSCHCSATIASNDTQTVPSPKGTPHPPCRWPTVRLEPVQSRHETALTTEVHNTITITHITGWRAYLGTAQHNYPHWTRVTLPEGRQEFSKPVFFQYVRCWHQKGD